MAKKKKKKGKKKNKKKGKKKRVIQWQDCYLYRTFIKEK